MSCCVRASTLPPRAICVCGSWDVEMIWMHMVTDGHSCKRCGRVWNDEYQIEMKPSDLGWANLPATGAARYAKQKGWVPRGRRGGHQS